MAKPTVNEMQGRAARAVAPVRSWKEEFVRTEIKESIETKESLLERFVEDIVKMADTIAASLRDGGKVVLFGNGGSAADAQHIAAELVGKFKAARPPLRAVALTTNSSILTAIGNDFGFEEVFSRQVAAELDEGDVAVGISTSGRSKNVISAIQLARDKGARTLALTGASGKELASHCDHSVMVPSTDTQRIQECHIMIGHIVCGLVESSLARLE